MRPDLLRYYQEGVFGFDPVIRDLDARFRMMDRHGDYAQILVLAVPPLEEVDPPQAAAELARRANEEMADLVRRFPDRFAGFAAVTHFEAFDIQFVKFACFDQTCIEYFSAEEVRNIDCDVCLECVAFLLALYHEDRRYIILLR